VRPLVALAAGALVGCDTDDAPPMGGRVESDSLTRAALATDFEARVDPDRFIGLDLRPLPEGVESLAASLFASPGVSSSQPSASGEAWAVDYVRAGGRPLLFLSRATEWTVEPMMDGDRRVGTRRTPHFRVVDALVVPVLAQGERVELAFCRTPAGRKAAAIGEWAPSLGTVRPVRVAWIVDEADERLEEVDAAGIRCRNPAVSGA